jgi:hypothetical protein
MPNARRFAPNGLARGQCEGQIRVRRLFEGAEVKKAFGTYAAILLMASVISGCASAPTAERIANADYIFSEISPDKAYRIDVYARRRESAMMPGQGGFSSKSALLVLKDAKGKTIGITNEECEAFFMDLAIKWDYPDNNFVSFAVARTIDLKTGECHY